MKKLFKIPYYFLVIGVASIGLLLLATLLPIPGNLRVKIVKSGSMEPAIKTGGLVFIREASSYKMGDVITFGQDTKTQIPTTHRIIEENGEGASKVFTTMGDANDAPDPKGVGVGEIRGKVIFSLPYAGFVLDFAKRPMGFLLLVGVPALIIIFEELIKIWKEIKRIRRRKNEEALEYVSSEALPRELERNVQSVYREGNVLDLRAKFEQKSREGLSFRRRDTSDFGLKAVSILLLAIVPLLGFGSVGSTVSYYNESEVSLGNILQAGNDYGEAFARSAILGISDFAPSLSEVPEDPPPSEVEENKEPEEQVVEENKDVVEEDATIVEETTPISEESESEPEPQPEIVEVEEILDPTPLDAKEIVEEIIEAVEIVVEENIAEPSVDAPTNI